MKIAIIGYGLQGESAYHYWSSHDNQITVCDSNTELQLPQGVQSQLGPDYLNGLEDFDLIVRSPIVHPRTLVAASSPQILNKVTTVTNEFFKVCPSPNIIGVTGTKGKGTTSTLITKMLEAAGHRVHLGGNIGTPPLNLLSNGIQPDDWVVLELANFQLVDLKYSPKLAVCLLVVPEHLDWQGSMAEYLETKSQLFKHQTPQDTAIYYSQNDNSRQIAASSPGNKIPYFAPPGALVEDGEVKIGDQVICRTDELKLLGKHNWQNVCAALTAVWQISQDVEAFRSVSTSFSGLPFRIEYRGTKNGIDYYNDSFASAPPAPIAAIEAISKPKVVIIGGFDRNLDLDELAEGLKRNSSTVSKILLVGNSAQRTAEALTKAGYTNFQVSDARDMTSIVGQATQLAKPGEVVILSPGFPSFDLFKNFEDRGRQFNAAVEAL